MTAGSSTDLVKRYKGHLAALLDQLARATAGDRHAV